VVPRASSAIAASTIALRVRRRCAGRSVAFRDDDARGVRGLTVIGFDYTIAL
jgi:hypothetical protein